MSTASTMPLWGQAYELVVTYATATGSQQTTLSSNTWEPDALRIKFDILQSAIGSPWWYADISVYNLNLQTVQNTLLNATWVTLKAGFQTGPSLYSIVWDGPVLQPLYTREAVVDQCVTFHCVANPLVMDSIVSFAMGPFSSQQQLVARMAADISLPPVTPAQGTQGPQANQLMTAKQYLRGNTVFGKAGKYITQIADDNFMQSWRDGQQAYISEVSNGNTSPSLVYSPPLAPDSPTLQSRDSVTYSLIGTPRQIPQGVIFTVLLDPRLKVGIPPLVVQLRRTLILQLAVNPDPNSQLQTALNADLTFFVAQVHHYGDSRGNDWHTEVTGYSTTYAAGLPFGIWSATAGGQGG